MDDSAGSGDDFGDIESLLGGMASRLVMRQVSELQTVASGNDKCLNCQAQQPTYVCLDFRTFVCQECSDIHREFGHRIKCIAHSEWTEEEFKHLEKGGNVKAAGKWLAFWDPRDFPKPEQADTDRLRDFIRKAYMVKCWQRQPGTKRSKKQTKTKTLVSSAGARKGEMAASPAWASSTAVIDLDDLGDNAAAQTSSVSQVQSPIVDQQFDPAAYTFLKKDTACFCSWHSSSEKREKATPLTRPCGGCHMMITSNYKLFSFCPGCSGLQGQCMLCGAPAPTLSSKGSSAGQNGIDAIKTIDTPGGHWEADFSGHGEAACVKGAACDAFWEADFGSDGGSTDATSNSKAQGEVNAMDSGSGSDGGGAWIADFGSSSDLAGSDDCGSIGTSGVPRVHDDGNLDASPGVRTTGFVLGNTSILDCHLSGFEDLSRQSTAEDVAGLFGKELCDVSAADMATLTETPSAPQAKVDTVVEAAVGKSVDSGEVCLDPFAGLQAESFGLANFATSSSQKSEPGGAGVEPHVESTLKASLFKATSSASVNIGEQLRQAVLRGKTDEVMGVFEQCKPKDPTEQVMSCFKREQPQQMQLLAPAAALQRGGGQREGQHEDRFAALGELQSMTGTAVVRSTSSTDLRSTVTGTPQRPALYSQKQLDGFDSQRLAAMQDLVTQALQQRAPLQPASVPAPAAATEPAPKEFDDLISAFSERNLIAGCESGGFRG